MADLGQVFDANNVEPSAPRELLPPGKYLAQIIKSEMKTTTKGGQALNLEFEIIDGPHARKHLWDMLNLVNANETAQNIAHKTLSAICHGTGQMQVSDSEQLHFKPLMVDVKIKPGEGQYPAKNVIGGYESAGNAKPVMQSVPTASAPRPVAATSSNAPQPAWRRTAG